MGQRDEECRVTLCTPVVRKLLLLALATKAGSPKLAALMNADPEIPERFKPLRADTVAYRLDNPIYAGVLRWAKQFPDVGRPTVAAALAIGRERWGADVAPPASVSGWSRPSTARRLGTTCSSMREPGAGRRALG